MLCYPIYDLKKDESGYYKIERNHFINKNNYKEYQENSYNEYCYTITPENKILERIYPDKIIELKMVVDNLYEFKNYENEISEKKIKKLVKKK